MAAVTAGNGADRSAREAGGPPAGDRPGLQRPRADRAAYCFGACATSVSVAIWAVFPVASTAAAFGAAGLPS